MTNKITSWIGPELSVLYPLLVLTVLIEVASPGQLPQEGHAIQPDTYKDVFCLEANSQTGNDGRDSCVAVAIWEEVVLQWHRLGQNERACSGKLKEQYYMCKGNISVMKKKGQKAYNKNLILTICFSHNVFLKFVSVLWMPLLQAVCS